MLTTNKAAQLIQKQRIFFQKDTTKSVDFRMRQLKILQSELKANQEEIVKALQQDLNKPAFESIASEVAYGIEEIKYTLKHLKSWAKPTKASTLLTQLPASSQVMAEPLGVVLIIGPWNYPFQLMIAPLIGAIAAGNCAILKPSELAPATAKIVSQIIEKCFISDYITVVEGDKDTTQELLAQKFDHIFFTGGTKIGQIIMEAAAKQLTPVTLELGGKSPCIVEPDIHLDYTARRIAWGKFINAGQTCIAPDYLLVHRQIKQPLLDKIKDYISEFYGENPAESPDYCRIINHHHWQRLQALIDPDKVIIGGDCQEDERYIAPTVMDNVTWEDAVMEDEIFGPILPIVEYSDLNEAIAQVNGQPKPLALYLFSKDKQKQNRVLQATSSGGVCLNDTIMHIASPTLPFGGVGQSGMGAYHGKASFDTFSHYKSVLNRSFLFDLKLRYPPYDGKLKFLNWLFR
ncbi:aldehyde dehydrogenase [Spirulina sp. CS-785/01]|uniref:aldehyde dehydrogenase n=1 Tax=Spirulina sp. CS-785/01 TaxID=3021716 RepID=UPI00232B3871|nr:aldehyde dehydrogenase [Spirulina sp. CS-785/01]MDB9312190.1 aldehyde dehydrogenase [Spirulina sp. CS-785/01]